jgi:hypothetical protein
MPSGSEMASEGIGVEIVTTISGIINNFLVSYMSRVTIPPDRKC